MAADAYVTAAAGHLESAANELKMEAEHIRGDFMTYDRQVTREINSKEAKLRSSIALLATATDEEHRHHLTHEVAEFKSDIDKQKQELEAKRKEMESAVSGKISDMNELMNKSRELRGKASSLK